MNKHKKLAFIVAPFLAIGGYIAADYYDRFQVDKKRYHTLKIEGKCDIDQGPCLLKGAGLILEYTIVGELTNIEANHPLGAAAIGMKGGEVEKPFSLEPKIDKKNWTIPTLEFKNSSTNSGTVRLVVTAKDHTFFSEFSNSQ